MKIRYTSMAVKVAALTALALPTALRRRPPRRAGPP